MRCSLGFSAAFHQLSSQSTSAHPRHTRANATTGTTLFCTRNNSSGQSNISAAMRHGAIKQVLTVKRNWSADGENNIILVRTSPGKHVPVEQGQNSTRNTDKTALNRRFLKRFCADHTMTRERSGFLSVAPQRLIVKPRTNEE